MCARQTGCGISPTLLGVIFGTAFLIVLGLPQTARSETTTINPTLVSVRVKGQESARRTFGINDVLEVEVRDLSNWRASQAADRRSLVLYVDGVPFPGTELTRADDDHADFQLSLPKSEENKKAWNRLLSSPTQFLREVHIAVGPAEQRPWAEAPVKTDKIPRPTTLTLVVLWNVGFWVYLAALALLTWLTFQLARKSNLLRDDVSKDSTQRGTYSLSRCQMAFWFFVVLASYLFIWLATGSIDSFSTSALGLLGISGGTGFVSMLIDRSKESAAKSTLQTAAQQQAVVKEIVQATGGLPTAVQYQALASSDQSIAEASKQLRKSVSESFFLDLLTDENGVTIHRLQCLVWNVVLGAIFLFYVYHALAMVELPGSLLGLLGLSSATYLGLKGSEKQ